MPPSMTTTMNTKMVDNATGGLIFREASNNAKEHSTMETTSFREEASNHVVNEQTRATVGGAGWRKFRSFFLLILVLRLNSWAFETMWMPGIQEPEIQQSRQRPHVMFYNIFIPKVGTNGEQEQKTFISLMEDVINEQLGQANNYISKNEQISVGQVKYVLIDSTQEGLFNETRVQNICSKYESLECQMIGDRHKGGNEYLTLTEVHKYCQNTEDKNQRVSYFHSKGTYHPNEFNDNWRRYLLKAMLAPECLDPPPSESRMDDQGVLSENTCNACGLQFQPVWNTMFPGNFWTAQCSMIDQLLDPVEYEKQLKATIKKMYNSQKFEAKVYTWEGWTLGFDRYAAEFWVGSHPDLVPCDFSQEPRIWAWSKATPPSNFTFATGVVRHPINTTKRHMMRMGGLWKVMHNETLRKQEYYFLPGLLVRWYALYKKFPPKDSWVWKHYPDAAYWQEQILKPSWMEEYQMIQNQSTYVEEWAKISDVQDVRVNKYWTKITQKNQSAVVMSQKQ